MRRASRPFVNTKRRRRPSTEGEKKRTEPLPEKYWGAEKGEPLAHIKRKKKSLSRKNPALTQRSSPTCHKINLMKKALRKKSIRPKLRRAPPQERREKR